MSDKLDFFLKRFFEGSLQCTAGQKKHYEHCFMKQKCQLQMGIAQYKNTATPLRTKGINTTHQHFKLCFSSMGSKVIK